MADIFLSYAREDRARAARLVDRIEAEGLGVYWDQATPAGAEWPELIESQLLQARCVLALWTHNSLASRWVRIEAYEAMQRHKLLPVLLDAVRQPLAFREIQAFDLIGWEGDPTDGRFTRLVKDLRSLMSTTPPLDEVGPTTTASRPLPLPLPAPTPQPPPSPDQRLGLQRKHAARQRVLALAIGATLIAATGYGTWRVSQTSPLNTEPTLSTDPTAPSDGSLAKPRGPLQEYGPYATLQRAEEVGRQIHGEGNKVLVVNGSGGYYVQVLETTATVGVNTVEPPTAAGRGHPAEAARQPATRPPTKAVSPRCTAILERLQLGEVLSAEDRTRLAKECP